MTTTKTATRDNSPAAAFRELSKAEQDRILSELGEQGAKELLASWRFFARPAQLEPAGDWFKWIQLGGRGSGKTRSLNEWLVGRVKQGYKHLGIVAKDKSSVRDILIEVGDSAILNLPSVQNMNVSYQPSKRRLVFKDYGATALLMSSDEPSQGRGRQYDTIICDELASWSYPERMFTNLVLACRIGKRPRIAIATTPKPIHILQELVSDPSCIVTGESTFANQANLSPFFIREIEDRYAGTHIEQQEIFGKILGEMPGAIFKQSMLDPYMVSEIPDDVIRIICLDPSGSGKGDEAGVIGLAVDTKGHFYVFADSTQQATPAIWGGATITLAEEHDCPIAYESNYGSGMCLTILKNINPAIECFGYGARGKKEERAADLVLKAEQGKFHILDSLIAVRDELLLWEPGSFSPGRLDALSIGYQHLAKKVHKIPAIKPPLEPFKKVSVWRRFGSGGIWDSFVNKEFQGD